MFNCRYLAKWLRPLYYIHKYLGLSLAQLLSDFRYCTLQESASDGSSSWFCCLSGKPRFSFGLLASLWPGQALGITDTWGMIHWKYPPPSLFLNKINIFKKLELISIGGSIWFMTNFGLQLYKWKVIFIWI